MSDVQSRLSAGLKEWPAGIKLVVVHLERSKRIAHPGIHRVPGGAVPSRNIACWCAPGSCEPAARDHFAIEACQRMHIAVCSPAESLPGSTLRLSGMTQTARH